jgi:carbon monoxide dehydrogenase subunit G
MRLEGTHLFTAPREAVWEALMDPGVLAGALPGGEQLEQTGDNQYRAVMNVKVGPVQGRFDGKILLEDIVAPQSYLMKVDGQGAPGFVAGEGRLQLEEADGGGTLLRYGGDVTVGGRIAGVGQRLIESTAKSITRQGLQALDQTIAARLVAASVVPEEAPAVQEIAQGEWLLPEGGSGINPVKAPAPTGLPEAKGQKYQPEGGSGINPVKAPAPTGEQAGAVSMTSVGVQVVKDVARDLAADYIPADKQDKVLYFSLGALAMLLFVVLVRLVQKD